MDYVKISPSVRVNCLKKLNFGKRDGKLVFDSDNL